MRFHYLIWIVICSGFLSHCSQKKGIIPQSPTAETPKNTEFQRDLSRFRGIDRGIDVHHYDLKIQYDWSRNILISEVAITLKLNPGSNEVILDSLVPKVNQVVWNNQKLEFATDATQGTMTIQVGAIKASNESLSTLVITYETPANTPLGDPAMWGRESSLVAYFPKLGDPIRSRVLYTMSEPLGVAAWMPCHNNPKDRATFSVEMILPENESMIANGDHISTVALGDGTKRVNYRTRYTLPVYLMAFAAGQFETREDRQGSVPVAVFARKGLKVDFEGLLRETRREIALFEKLLGPYPFEKYNIILLPDFPAGGMEHAGITFNHEDYSSQGSMGEDMNLLSHELAHHWFGDLMTIKSWDDLWIKEGMATLLGAEASRPLEDAKNSGRLFGSTFHPRNGEASYDPSLGPSEKYNTGPYDRAAWILTQMRDLAGDDMFWRTLRNVLKKYAFDAISTDEFLEAFRPVLGDAHISQIQSALRAKALPQLQIAQNTQKSAVITLVDSEKSLISPMTIAGKKLRQRPLNLQLLPSTALTLDHLSDHFWIPDPNDTHPEWSNFVPNGDMQKYRDILSSLFVPPMNSDGWNELAELPAHAQVYSFEATPDAWSLTATQFQHLFRSLSADSARFSAWKLGCRMAQRESETPEASVWSSVFSNLMFEIPRGALGRGSHGLEVCRDVVSASNMKALLNDVENNRADEVESTWVSQFPIQPGQALKSWQPMSRMGESIRQRVLAGSFLLREFRHIQEELEETEIPQWFEHFQWLIRESRVNSILSLALEGASLIKDPRYLEDLSLIPGDSTLSVATRREGICTAVEILDADSNPQGIEWIKWRTTVEVGISDPGLLSVLKNPSQCP